MAHQTICGCNSVVECHLAKVKVASPNLVTRSKHALVAQLDRASDYESEGREFESLRAHQKKSAVVAQLVERILGKDKVTGSIPVNGSSKCGSGVIGRRARLRGVWVTPYGFKSRLPHQLRKICGEVLKWLKRTVC